MQQSTVFLRVQKLREQAELVTWQLQSKDPEKPGQKQRNVNVKQEQIILNVMEKYEK
jgi:hypothetical protein